jgi:ribonucleotide monophosphatase NagD (HAD superfamily)
METVAEIFHRYEAVRNRLPAARLSVQTSDIDNLLDIAGEADAFVFDAFGVLNIGETPIPGAAERLDQLRAAGKAIRILSNAASYSHTAAAEKFRRLGMNVASDEIITSRDAAIAELGPGLWGCITSSSDDLRDIKVETCRLGGDMVAFDQVDGFLFLSSAAWTADHQIILERSLRERPRPLVVANADLVAPREGGFTLEPGHFAHLLADAELGMLEFFGKPFPHVYELIEQSLPGISAERIVMCGDTLHTDILGAAGRGWRTVLVTEDGLFSGEETTEYCQQSQIYPDWRTKRI